MKNIKTMKNKLFFSFLFCAFLLINAQNDYPRFPKDQHSYLGGDKVFFKDFHKILIEKNLKPCENKKEHPVISFLIKSENSVEVLNLDDAKLQENKCTFELTKEVVKYMDKWIPAKIDGKETPAIKKFFICPDDLFENYKDGYIDAENTDFDANLFRKEVVKNIDLSRVRFNGTLTTITKFRVNIEGKIDDVKIEKSSGSQKLDEIILKAIEKTTATLQYKPGIYLGKPINLYFRVPFSASLN